MNINKIWQSVLILLEKFMFLFHEDKAVYEDLSDFNFLKEIERNHLLIRKELLQNAMSTFKSMEDLCLWSKKR